jgi:hypothetical protein
MKNLAIAFFAVMTVSIGANATVISSTTESISPVSIDQVVRVVDQQVPGSSHLKASFVVLDGGMSTDVSPRYTVFFTVASLAEMGSIGATFKITDQAFEFKSVRKISEQIFEVSFVEYRDSMYDVTLTIDASQVFADELQARKDCPDFFCEGDVDFQSTVSVKETATLLP